MEEEKAEFFKIEKQKYKLIEEKAKQAYLDAFWNKQGEKYKSSSDNAKTKYMEENAKVTKQEIDSTYEQYKDHPRLKELSDKEKRSQVEKIVYYQKEQAVIQSILDQGLKRRDLVILYPRPEEPRFDVKLTNDDFLKYDENMDEKTNKPQGCQKEKCQKAKYLTNY